MSLSGREGSHAVVRPKSMTKTLGPFPLEYLYLDSSTYMALFRWVSPWMYPIFLSCVNWYMRLTHSICWNGVKSLSERYLVGWLPEYSGNWLPMVLQLSKLSMIMKPILYLGFSFKNGLISGYLVRICFSCGFCVFWDMIPKCNGCGQMGSRRRLDLTNTS